jgi:REP element-mobilizing transposase RayT
MRKIEFSNNEIYHICNRGVDKRLIFGDTLDLDRFIVSMQDFNSIEPIGSLYEFSFIKKSKNKSTKKNNLQLGHSMSKLVEIIAYCLNPNHYHILLRQNVEGGVEKFMQKLGNGYTKYFNNKYKRSGVLFQGRFRANHVNSNECLLRANAYVNLNNRIDASSPNLSRSSWKEYLGESTDVLCSKNIILEQFESINDYKEFSLDTLEDIRKNKILQKKLEDI